MTLVRPDGYVAFATTHPDGLAALRSVCALLERQTASGSCASTAGFGKTIQAWS
jgi:hypothetical protein